MNGPTETGGISPWISGINKPRTPSLKSRAKIIFMKNVTKLLLVTCFVGLVGWRVIRALFGGRTLKYIRKLMGEEWVEREIMCAEPRHVCCT